MHQLDLLHIALQCRKRRGPWRQFTIAYQSLYTQQKAFLWIGSFVTVSSYTSSVFSLITRKLAWITKTFMWWGKIPYKPIRHSIILISFLYLPIVYELTIFFFLIKHTLFYIRLYTLNIETNGTLPLLCSRNAGSPSRRLEDSPLW